MPANIEIKARVAKLAALERRVAPICDGPPEILVQEDVFFAAPSGRLKLRIISAERGELILYHRSDITGPKTSHYTIAPTSEPNALRAILTQVLPLLAVVKKRRSVYLVGQTRVHLDQVEDLGDFVELEVVLRAGQSEADGITVARGLMAQLEIDESQLVDRAYVDLLRR